MREAKATKAISLIVAINVCPTGAREGGGCYRTTCICYCYGYITHTPCCLWLASITARQSTVQRSTTRTSIFHPHTINIPCCCCCFPRAIFCSVHRSAFPPLLLGPEYFTHLLRLVGCECICLAEGKALLQALFLCLPRAAFPIFPSKMF